MANILPPACRGDTDEQMTSPVRKPDLQPDLALDQFLNVRIQRLASKMNLIATRQMLKGTGIGLKEWRTIVRLKSSGPLNMTAISRIIGMDPGPTSRMLKAAERKGLLLRRSDPSDGRAVVFDLTERGEAVYTRVWPIAQGVALGFDDLFSKDERRELFSLLDRALAHANRELGVPEQDETDLTN